MNNQEFLFDESEPLLFVFPSFQFESETSTDKEYAMLKVNIYSSHCMRLSVSPLLIMEIIQSERHI